MRRTAGMIGSVVLIGCFFAAAVGNASGPEIARALNRLADTLQPAPIPASCQVIAVFPVNLSSPLVLWLILVGMGILLLGGGVELYRRVVRQPLDPKEDSLGPPEPDLDETVEWVF